MRVLILGGEGMLGYKVFQVLDKRFEVCVSFLSPNGGWMEYPVYQGISRRKVLSGVNALNFKSVENAFKKVRPDVVINCIGIIKQLKEAHDPILSISVNSLFPHLLARLCIKNKHRLFHISTDCVFSGIKGNYTEEDISDAEDLYGRTKFLGEIDQPGCVTLRTSLIGRDFSKKSSLLEWFLAQAGGKVKGFTHAIYSGLITQALANIIADLISDYPQLRGLYQVASDPISKYDLLIKIRDAMKLDIDVEPCDGFKKDLSLNANRFVKATGYKIPSWDDMVKELAADKTPYNQRS